ncbi:SURF1 family protein [Pseudomonas sp. zfem002]|uniref:SURF1 family protein n=1 Tax=Pseudomonas sp. zfem002 TaxID=3078197 RepID=UPI00292A31BC|nr:SURF1 family protein [Pseudomonas sp. zfem002]MDU9393413.1 SURF1 family protein [Pseudomonas sp. zfem002]
MRPFRPGLVPTLVVLALLPLLVGLGLWQLGRAEQKRALLEVYAEREIEAPVPAGQLPDVADPAYRRVHLHGHFDGDHSLLLDSRMRDGQAGVELLQPFLDEPSGRWWLVNRGWLPWPDRRVAVSFATPHATLDLTAWIYIAPGASFLLRADAPAGEFPRLLNSAEPTHLWEQLARDGYAHELRLEAGPASYRVDWPPVALGPEKHLGYAVQWFALATALIALYLYFGWHRHDKKEKSHGSRHGTTRHV